MLFRKWLFGHSVMVLLVLRVARFVWPHATLTYVVHMSCLSLHSPEGFCFKHCWATCTVGELAWSWDTSLSTTQSILDWKISIALEIFKRHLKTLKIQSIFQVLQKSNFNRIFKRNVLKIQSIFQSIFQSKMSVSSYVSHSSAHHLAVDSWMAWRAIQPRGSFQPKRMLLDPWAIQPKMFCNS